MGANMTIRPPQFSENGKLEFPNLAAAAEWPFVAEGFSCQLRMKYCSYHTRKVYIVQILRQLSELPPM